ncbi:DUF1573 domain-containing protein [bacterium]|nr:DUF1573 domain-containing protein [candidate division CSSED10-310 bacterium]
MKIVLKICLCVLGIMTGCVALATDIEPAAEFAPRIEFSEISFDFGTQVAGSILKHSFQFRNTGMVPLFIESVKAG